MNKGTLTPQSSDVVRDMRFTGGFGQPDGFASTLTALVRKSGALCLTLDYRVNDREQMWSVELTSEQRHTLAELLLSYEPRHWEAINKGLDGHGASASLHDLQADVTHLKLNAEIEEYVKSLPGPIKTGNLDSDADDIDAYAEGIRQRKQDAPTRDAPGSINDLTRRLRTAHEELKEANDFAGLQMRELQRCHELIATLNEQLSSSLKLVDEQRVALVRMCEVESRTKQLNDVPMRGSLDYIEQQRIIAEEKLKAANDFADTQTAELRQCHEQIATLTEQVNSYYDTQRDASLRLLDARTKVESLTEELRKCHTLNEQLTSKLNTTNEQRDRLQARVSEVRGQLDNNKQIELAYSKFEQENSQLTVDLRAVTDSRDLLRDRARGLHEQINNLQDRLHQALTTITELNKKAHADSSATTSQKCWAPSPIFPTESSRYLWTMDSSGTWCYLNDDGSVDICDRQSLILQHYPTLNDALIYNKRINKIITDRKDALTPTNMDITAMSMSTLYRLFHQLRTDNVPSSLWDMALSNMSRHSIEELVKKMRDEARTK